LLVKLVTKKIIVATHTLRLLILLLWFFIADCDDCFSDDGWFRVFTTNNDGPGANSSYELTATAYTVEGY